MSVRLRLAGAASILTLLGIVIPGCGGGGGIVTVTPPPTPASALTALSVSPSSTTLNPGGTAVLTPVPTTAPGATVSYSWTSSATSVATVNGSGVVTAAAAGTSTITVVGTGSGAGLTTSTQSATALITVSSVNPTIVSVAPSQGSVAGGTVVTISGTNFAAGASVTFGGIAATAVTVNSATTITCTTPARSSGAVAVVVTNADNRAAQLPNGFTYVAPSPTVTSVSPNSSGIAGNISVTITGTGFAAVPSVTFGGTPATTVSFTNSTSIVARVPAHAAGTVDVVVTNPDTLRGTLPNGFTYVGPPTMANIKPASGSVSGGTTVIITGAGFSSTPTVSFGDTPATSVTFNSSTSISATTPARTAGPVSVTVTNPDAQSVTLVNAFTYVAPPTVTSVSPPTGSTAGGTSVTITGTGFAPVPKVAFGVTAAATVAFISSTSIVATAPQRAAGPVTITVTNPDSLGGSLVNAFTYIAPAAPTISGVTPTSGSTAGGTTITIAGTNFASGATVSLGVTSATGVVVNSATSITAITPARPAGTVSLVVTNPDAQSATSANAYTYSSPTPAPAVTGLNPGSGSKDGGYSITVIGTNFVSGATVSFGGTLGTGVVLNSPSQLSVVVPARATAVNEAVSVTVTNPDGQSGTLPNSFTYTVPAVIPTITAITPNKGGTLGGTTVIITGTNFVTGASVTFGGTSATGVVVNSATSITAVTPPRPFGAVAVAVRNPDTQFALVNGGYTYLAPITLTKTTWQVDLTYVGGTFRISAFFTQNGTDVSGTNVDSNTGRTITTTGTVNGTLLTVRFVMTAAGAARGEFTCTGEITGTPQVMATGTFTSPNGLNGSSGAALSGTCTMQ